MSDREAHDRSYTFFHEDGPITVSEHELCNGYMQLRKEMADIARLALSHNADDGHYTLLSALYGIGHQIERALAA